MDQLEKFEEQMPLKDVRKNKIYTIKNHSLNSLSCDDNRAYLKTRTTKQTTLLENQMGES